MWIRARGVISKGLQAVGLFTVAKSVDDMEEKQGNFLLIFIFGLLAIIIFGRR